MKQGNDGMRKQSVLKIQLPAGERMYAGRFRELLAKEGDGNPAFPPAFFHYGADGKTLQGKPDIRCIGGHSWVGILSQGGDSDIFNNAAMAASQIVSNHYQRPLSIEVEAPSFGLKLSSNGGISRPITYYAREVAIKRRHAARREAKDEDLVKQVILSGLAEIADRYGFDLPPENMLGFRLHDLKTQGLQLMTTFGLTKEYVTLANVEFSINASLRGIWQVGSLQARGYGRIIEKRQEKKVAA